MRALVFVLLALASLSSHAHKPSDAYWSIQIEGQRVTQRLDIALRDLDRELAIDANDDGQLSWGEVRAQWPQIASMADAGAQAQAVGTTCRAEPGGPSQLDQHSDGRYAVLTRTLHCDAPVTAVTLHYNLFAASDPTHRGIARIDLAGATHTAVLGPGNATLQVGEGHASAHTLPGFIAEGVHHILVGIDHVLFLLALLLPAVLVRQATSPQRDGAGFVRPHIAAAGAVAFGFRTASFALSLPTTAVPALPQRTAEQSQGHSTWHPAPALRTALWEIMRIVSAFTLAHSITLALAVFDVVNPPSRWVESIIAASVVFAALNNLYPVVSRQRWLVTFGFGLVHGFGFAGALKDLGLTEQSLVWPLLGFNVGVELGQLAIVALFVPIAWTLRGTRAYRNWAMQGGSWLIALVALVWFAERALDLRLTP